MLLVSLLYMPKYLFC